MIVVLVDPDGERTMFPSRAASAQIAPVDDAPGWTESAFAP